MKVIVLAWRDPNNNLKVEKFDQADFSVKTDPGWLKLIGKDGPVRLIPSDKVTLVEFTEEQEPPRIITPTLGPTDVPKGFQAS